MGDFSHLSTSGKACMVDLTGKQGSQRVATVRGRVQISPECRAKLTDSATAEIVTTARIAGIQASKKTYELVPLCHQILLSKVDLTISLDREGAFIIDGEASTEASTGVEMEAFTAVSVAALTIYDMIKAADPAATIGPFHLREKVGGKSGLWVHPDE